jgi:hypothetical protein
LFRQARPAFRQERVFQNARSLAISSLLALGRHSVSGMLAAAGREFEDWSSAYRIFEQRRIDRKALFAPAQAAVLENIPEHIPLTVMMDDTLIRKRGRKVSGAGWKRDPLGPPWHTNFVWGQRFLQLSAALPEHGSNGRAVGIPIDFIHAPGAVKPERNAPQEKWDEYRKEQEKLKLSTVAANRLKELGARIEDRKIICAVDGGYTNKTVFRGQSANTVLVGRIRKDARLFAAPEKSEAGKGRKKFYGDRKPTPEEIRQDESVPWQTVQAYAAGKCHEFEIKTVTGIRWKGTGGQDLRLVVVRPLAYRPRKGAKLLYRDPAYLLCTDPDLPLEQMLQSYLWRWEIEVNFRDEKHVMGVGESQLRTKASVENVPGLICASYSFLLLASMRANCNALSLPRPKWYPAKPADRCSTQQLVALFRTQLWGLAIKGNKTHFVNAANSTTNPLFLNHSLPSAVCYARK